MLQRYVCRFKFLYLLNATCQYLRRYFGNVFHNKMARNDLSAAPAPIKNALFTASRHLTGRELYAKEEKDDVIERAQTLIRGGTKPRGSFQVALKDLWDNADEGIKAKYESVAEDLAAVAVNIPQ